LIQNGAKAKLASECLGFGKESMYFPTNHPLFALFSINDGNIAKYEPIIDTTGSNFTGNNGTIGNTELKLNDAMSVGIIIPIAFLITCFVV
jgi:hypothetical protein